MGKKKHNILIILVIIMVISSIWLFYKSGVINIPGFKIQAYEDVIISPEEMKQDLDYIVTTLRNVHPKTYIDFSNEQKQVIDNAYGRIKNSMTVSEFYFIANEIISSMQDGHTSMYMQTGSNSRLINLKILWLNDGMYVGDDTGELLRGDKIISIGGKNENALLLELEKVIPSENPQWVKVIGSTFMVMEPYLKYLGVISENRVSIAVDRQGQSILSTLPIIRKGIRIDLGSKNWVSYSVDKENSLGVFKLDQCVYNDEYTSTLKNFFKEVTQYSIKNVAIDVRDNLGGNSMVIDEFISYLDVDKYTSFTGDIRYSKEAQEQRELGKSAGYESYPPDIITNKKTEDPNLIFRGNLFVLTSPSTFSSANWFAVMIKDNKLGTIIGEPTGNQPSSYGDVLIFETPNAGLSFQVSYKKWVRPDPSRDPVNCLEPDIIVYTAIEDIIDNRDVQIEELKKIISSKK